jgi:hypothetical protein
MLKTESVFQKFPVIFPVLRESGSGSRSDAAGRGELRTMPLQRFLPGLTNPAGLLLATKPAERGGADVPARTGDLHSKLQIKPPQGCCRAQQLGGIDLRTAHVPSSPPLRTLRACEEFGLGFRRGIPATLQKLRRECPWVVSLIPSWSGAGKCPQIFVTAS